MKTITACLIAFGTIGAVSAQTSKPASKTAETNSKAVATEATLSSMESVLSDGKMQFSKKTVWSSAGSAPSTTYYLLARNSSFNGGKPFAVNLNKGDFDNYFQKSSPEINQKWLSLVKFAQEKKLSYTEEESWIKILNYLNSIL